MGGCRAQQQHRCQLLALLAAALRHTGQLHSVKGAQYIVIKGCITLTMLMRLLHRATHTNTGLQPKTLVRAHEGASARAKKLKSALNSHLTGDRCASAPAWPATTAQPSLAPCGRPAAPCGALCIRMVYSDKSISYEPLTHRVFGPTPG